jgi:signal peptidase I
MEPEFKTGQILNFVPLSSDRPQRCDVVLYHPANAPSQVTFKRVVAVGGDTVSFGVSSVQVNGKEPCPAVLHGNQGEGSATTHMAPSQYFVVGDNLPDSEDSRLYGPIDRSSILGYLPG